jgi:homoserine O-acetyltransferase
MEPALKRVKHGSLLLIPASPDTAGHGTTAQAKWWKKELGELLGRTPKSAF